MKGNFKKKGMTLIEVVISLAIIAVVLTGFMAMFSGGYANIIRTGRRNKAAEEARKVMEVITEKSPSLPEDYTSADIMDIIDDIGSSYKIEITELEKNYAPVSTAPYAVMCKITIRVYYDNDEKYVELTSMINQ